MTVCILVYLHGIMCENNNYEFLLNIIIWCFWLTVLNRKHTTSTLPIRRLILSIIH